MHNDGSDDEADVAAGDRAEDQEQEDANGGSEDGDHEKISTLAKNQSYLQISYGFQNRGSYRHASKNCEIVGVTHNSRFRQFIILDSRGITTWSYESVYNTVTRQLNYPSYQFNLLRLLVFSRKFNVYFALSREYALKIFNLNFHEVFSVSADMHSVLCMVFNPVRDELITGGTGGMKFWTFGELETDKQKAWERGSRPMANYGLVLRASYPNMGGSWVKQVQLDQPMQRLYCLSERDVLAYDMEGNSLFQINDAHRGPVTGCVYSKACNLLVTAGTDGDVNVWSRSGGKVHTFAGHTKAVTKVLLHPETSSVVLSSSLDGLVKVYSLEMMEEIYSLPVFSEGIQWMEIIANKTLYCSSNRVIEVFFLNYIFDFWSQTRCSATSLSLVTSHGKSSRVLVVGNDSSVRLISRRGVLLSTVLPPPSISPLHQVLDVAYNREYSMMFLLINEHEIWVYYTRTNPATRMDVWEIVTVEDIHTYHSRDAARSRTASPTLESFRSPSPRPGASPVLSSRAATPSGLPVDNLHPRFDHVQITCLGVLYSHVLMDSEEGDMCPDTTSFLLAGTQDGRVLFLHMFWKALKYHELQAHKDKILSVHHDQVTNTLVTKCRAHGGLLAVQIWSVPFLQLQKQISCPGDLTCFARMNDRLMCGYESGHLRLYSTLSGDDSEIFEEQEVTSSDNKRPVPRDHQDAINSIDANLSLEIFCTASQDGCVKLWDKDKNPLCEIMADQSLTVTCFLNNEGDILAGFKQQIFRISHKKVCAAWSLKERNEEQDKTHVTDEEAFETESDVYEDPSVRWDSKKILQPDPTNMQNYLVPFPNLLQKTSWFLEGRPPPVLDYQDDDEDGQESQLALSDSVSLAPTDIYYSAQSTPRSMSLASLPIWRDSTGLWELPDFGDSPVSSPPRTPPPQPTPPPTPPPEEPSEKEIAEEETKVLSEVKQEDEAPCVPCKESKKKSRKKGPSIPSFKREGGRFGNVKIDSRSLRSKKGQSKLDPKDDKQRLQKPVSARKMKKLLAEERRQAEKEELAKELQNEAEVVQKEDEPKPPTVDDKQPQPETDKTGDRPPDANGQPEGQETRLADDTTPLDDPQVQLRGAVDGTLPPPLAPLPPRNQFMFPNQTPPAAESAEAQQNLASDGNPLDPNAAQNNSNSLDGEPGNQVNQENELAAAESAENKEQGGEENAATNDDPVVDHVNDEEGPRDSSPVTAFATYVDPDTGEIVERPLEEIPDGVEILDIFQEGDCEEAEEEEGEGFQEFEEGEIVGELPSEPKTKSVKFKLEGKGRRKRESISKQNPEATPGTQESHVFRTRWISSPKTTVVPVYDAYLTSGIQQRKSNNDLGVSPLTIFALAKNRRQNEATRDALDYRYTSRQTQTSPRKPQPREIYIPRDKWEVESLGSSDDDYIQLMEDVGLVDSESARSAAESHKPQNSKNTRGDMMKWCVQALKKTKSAPIFPQKPSRPGSSPSSTTSKTKSPGDTLFLNIPPSPRRPKTAGSAGSQETYTLYPYKNFKETGDHKRRVPDRKLATEGKAHAQKAASSDEDEDLLDVYKELHSTLKDATPIPLYVPSSSGDDRLQPPRDLPVLDINDYSGNWQNKVLERARRLKQQRLERQKSATVRRQMLESQQRERRKRHGHVECSQDASPKPERIVEFLRSSSAPVLSENASAVSQDFSSRDQNQHAKDFERPYRVRVHPQSNRPGLTRTAKSLMDVTSSEHDLTDIVQVLPKPPSAASIPSKCSRFVLITQGSDDKRVPEPTPLERKLLLLRFPNSRVSRRHPTEIVSRPHTGHHVRVGTEQEY